MLANVIGTTGASVLLIRPLLRANAPRVRKTHIVVFFIFVVSNCGGLLTPLGDPPLFLGFLKGVPFEWTLRLWPQWLLVNGIAARALQRVGPGRLRPRGARSARGRSSRRCMQHEPLRIEGAHNFAFLLGVVAVIYAAGRGLGNGGEPWPFGVQEALMAGARRWHRLARPRPAALRAANRFSVRADRRGGGPLRRASSSPWRPRCCC